MIGPELVRQCRDVDGLARVLGSLGYDVTPVEVDLPGWPEAGLPPLPEGRWYHLGRIGAVDLVAAVEGGAPSGMAERFLNRIATINKYHKIVIFIINDKRSTLSLLTHKGRRLQRLELSLDDPKPEAIARLNDLDLDSWHRDRPIDAVVDRALDREAVSRKFFARFRRGVDRLGSILKSAAPASSNRQRFDEALLILSRILFLYFIQERGWLDRNRRYLIDRFQRVLRCGGDYSSEVLVPLFFGCLNTPRAMRLENVRELGAVPYLNGGLFEPSPFERKYAFPAIPNDVIGDALETTFEHFSFNAEESGTDDVQVDPEMLGKVFESLMEEDERLGSGSFYTPRELVDVLVRDAIVSWCAGGEDRLRLQLERALNGESFRIPAARSGVLLGRLETISVLDPACGSGAFLLSALRQIETLTIALLKSLQREVPVDLRQSIVERSLFGVDLKPEAVRLCELRLWLAIVSACSFDVDDVPPLPNLDRNILQGNSLLSPLDFLGEARGGVYREWRLALKARAGLLDRYRRSSPAERPALVQKLRQSDLALSASLLMKVIEIDEKDLRTLSGQQSLRGVERSADVLPELERRLSDLRVRLRAVKRGEIGFFSYDTHFAQILARGGFDVVTGNPPWIRKSRIAPDERRLVADRYALFRGSSRSFNQSDLAIAFFEKSLSLTTPGGVMSVLLPAKVMTAGYARSFRTEVVKRTSILSIRDWSGDSRRMFSADTFPLGLTIRKAEPRGFRAVVSDGVRHYELSQESLSVSEPGSEWSLVSAEVRTLLDRIRGEHRILSDVLGRNPIMGVKTGHNRRFLIPETRIRGGRLIVDGIAIPREGLVRCVRGRDIRAWKAADSGWMIWPPSVGRLRGGREEWVERLTRHWSMRPEDFSLSYVRPEHMGVKIVWKDVSRGLQAVVLPDTVRISGIEFPVVPNQTAYMVDASSIDEAYAVCAILNSTVFGALAASVADRAKDFHFRYFASTIARIPLAMPEADSGPWRALVRLSRRGHQGDAVGDVLDRVVQNLYGLTARDHQLLERYLAMRLGRDEQPPGEE